MLGFRVFMRRGCVRGGLVQKALRWSWRGSLLAVRPGQDGRVLHMAEAVRLRPSTGGGQCVRML